ncbi:MAG TPA: 30S ribosomal protein S12 methylthiotransferase RimO [Thermodesulfobacteriota bacterium]|nr:30S ribosomal protein S12 methylthiotransferase RimO [Thermodesulfobacteriota bacterium]
MSHPPVYLVSLGCAKNLVDSQVMLGALLKAQYPVASSPAQAEIIIINTCAFINAAKKEALETIFELAQYKKSGSCNYLIVSGCLPQRYGKSLSKLLPEVDVFIGTGEFYRIREVVESLRETKTVSRFYLGRTRYLYDDRTDRVNTSFPGSAYIKIAEGCSHCCSFCIIPKIRGRFRSRLPGSIVKEALNLSAQGVKEINLIAQDTTMYGRDLSPQVDLAFLLRRLAKVEGIEWIRLHYANPQNISDELIRIIKEEEKMCKYFDIPLQHINSTILKAMKRKNDPRFLCDLIAKIRNDIPEATIRTTLMVGFPGETAKQFNELVGLVKRVKFDHLGVFAYSHEEGTVAAKLPSQLTETIKEKRRRDLMRLQARISRGKNKRFIGTVQKVLVEKKERSGVSGRLSSQAPEVDGKTRVITKHPILIPGEIYNILVIKTGAYDLEGKVCSLSNPEI